MGSAVLVIEDEATLAKNIAVYLGRQGHEVVTADTAETGLAELERFKPDVVLLDFHLPGMDGMAALGRLAEQAPGIPVIMVTGHGTVELAVEAMKNGAYDFLTKPLSLAKLRLLIERALGESRREEALSYYRRREAALGDRCTLIGESPPMMALKARIDQLIEAESKLRDGEPPAALVTGETGTGKELVARALHFSGPRASKPFVEINCAAIPAQLLESELFGHERGAFTDARERKIGLVETAEGGTLFLDEIGDLDLGLQAKLLKLLEEKTVRRLGSLRDQKVDVRIVAATHRPMEQHVRDGRFRADLYYRLRIVEFRLPSLRERGDDVLLLARHFLQLHAGRYGRSGMRFSPAAEAMLVRHRWPGNVRELRNLMEQSVLMCAGDAIGPEHLNLSPLGLDDDEALPGAGAASGRLEDVERNMLVGALQQTGWNITQAARLLGISRDTLRYRIEKYRLAQEG
ncbi:sigma-54-dependent transcriptional regulator [Cognatazoarcus halotolerans]|uniref:sigma-54-dependent transcriptional regulator n=1 Tax=Cognatazoarcus halotolerans TaxID=2686016 RepID=UPI001358FE8D|nr:sigma-54 dependent transcriptional regulator [Cognatazoarcus halotolerans]MCB1901140.1 sigma-54-dependent Fis family transcriptional regulator [Rhodocyclaceae bacterium]MCP5310409.1 sigma-54-dependent Fis family transcriptional regulator [Zoogloeaceae bacterium]